MFDTKEKDWGKRNKGKEGGAFWTILDWKQAQRKMKSFNALSYQITVYASGQQVSAILLRRVTKAYLFKREIPASLPILLFPFLRAAGKRSMYLQAFLETHYSSSLQDTSEKHWSDCFRNADKSQWGSADSSPVHPAGYRGHSITCTDSPESQGTGRF